MLSKRVRTIVLFTVLAVTVINIAVAVATNHQVPEALYGILGAVGGYALLGKGNGNGNGNGGREAKP